MIDVRADDIEMLVRLLAALAAGTFIGYERSFHGRPAGLRTHVLVCLASSLLMLVTVYEDYWVRTEGMSRLDPTRMAQGIMTGIGFLGAGVIVKEGFSVRGLTTAASIWVAAAIGVVIGAGSYLTGAEASIVTLVALALLRHLEDRLPAQSYVRVDVAFDRSLAMDEDRFRQLIERHGFKMGELAYRLSGDPSHLEYRAVVWTSRPQAISALEASLLAQPEVLEFAITPTHD